MLRKMAVRIETRKCTNGLKRGRSDANKRQTFERFVDEEWLIDHCIHIANARTFVAHFSKITIGWDVWRKSCERLKQSYYWFYTLNNLHLFIYIYIYVLENFTKRFDQVILMYKIGNTRIEFQTSSRIKLQLVGSINESRPFTSLRRLKEIGYVENRE